MKAQTQVILENSLQQVAKYASEEWLTDQFAEAILNNGADSLFEPTFEFPVLETRTEDGVQITEEVVRKISGLATMASDPMRGVITTKSIFRQIVRECDWRITSAERAQERARGQGIVQALNPVMPDARGCSEGTEDDKPEVVQITAADAYAAVDALHDLLDEYYQEFTKAALGHPEALPFHSVQNQGSYEDIHTFEEARQHLARAREQKRIERRQTAGAAILAMGMKPRKSA